MKKKELLQKVKPKPNRRKPNSRQKLPHQFGSVTRYNDGNRLKPYIVRGPRDPATGKQPFIAAVSTEEEAYEILIKRRNNPYLFAKNATTFKDAYELFLMSHYNELGKQAQSNCRSCWKHCEFLADKKFRSITVSDLQLVIENMHDKGITYDMQRKVRQLMHYIYTAAVKYELIKKDDDKTIGVDIDPKLTDPDKQPFNRRQLNRVKALITTASPEIAGLAMIVVMMCYAGTRPSEFSFYPVPKLFIRRVGGHEQWGAIHSAEIGDGTLECRDIPHTLQMMKLFLEEKTLLCDMCDNIVKNKEAGIYDGAYKVVELAFSMKQKKF